MVKAPFTREHRWPPPLTEPPNCTSPVERMLSRIKSFSLLYLSRKECEECYMCVLTTIIISSLYYTLFCELCPDDKFFNYFWTSKQSCDERLGHIKGDWMKRIQQWEGIVNYECKLTQKVNWFIFDTKQVCTQSPCVYAPPIWINVSWKVTDTWKKPKASNSSMWGPVFETL